MAITISVAMQKGGVGKTTTAQTLASILGTKNKRVLLLDMDSQCNATVISGIEDPQKTIIDVLAEDCSIKDAIEHCSLYDLLCADELLANLEKTEDLESTILKTILSTLQSEYDYIIIDTPPALGNLLLISLIASDYVIIPTDPRSLALRGMDALQATIEAVQASNRRLKVLGILLIKYHERTILNRQMREVLEERAELMDTIVFKTQIREGIAVPESQAMQMSLVEYAPKSNPCIDYESFVDEMLGNIE